MRHDLAMGKQNAPRSRSTRVADCSIWKLPSSRAGATARSARCVQGVRQQRCQPGVGPEDEHRQRWRRSGMVMLLSRIASVGDMPYPLLLCCGILCRCADNSSCGEALGRARDGRTRLPLSLQAPSLPIAASLKPAAKRRRTAVFTSLEAYIEIKYTWTIRRHPPFSSVTFSISKFQSSLGRRCSANS